MASGDHWARDSNQPKIPSLATDPLKQMDREIRARYQFTAFERIEKAAVRSNI
jgi:hypothetical protein